jgi:hypothetical protein
MYTAKGKATPRKLGSELFKALLQLWCEQNAEYAALVARFKEQQRQERRRTMCSRPHLLASNIADWQNTRPALTPTEINWIAMQPHVKVLMFMRHVFVLCYNTQSSSRLQYAGYEIRTERSQSSNVTDNSKVRVPLIGSRGRLEQFYGSVKAIFTHEAWTGGPELCVLEIEWFVSHGTSTVSGNPLVGPPGAQGSALNRYTAAVYISRAAAEVTSDVLQACSNRKLLPNTSCRVAT